jgi:imidazole glycerol-phosphate synthase subunit HisH
MIALIDYGLGNIKAFANVYSTLNIPFVIAKNSEDVKSATKIILPGVGAFDYAMQRLNDSGMCDALNEMVIIKKVPVIGICVGMQMLANRSEEGSLPGLGWIDGEVKKFILPQGSAKMRIPHMGWNNMKPVKQVSLLNGLDQESKFYFLHSYYFKCHIPENVIAVTDYQGVFESIVNNGNVYGIQFHPEKSHGWGVKLLENFAKL